MTRILLFAAISILSASVLAQEPVLRSGNRVEIRISNVPESDRIQINGTYPIADNGSLKLPYIGSKKASGLTPSKLADEIERAFLEQEIFTTPVVLATTSTSDRQLRVSVSGEVKKVSLVDFVEGLRLSEAITSAGGYTDFARGQVLLTRAGRVAEYSRRDLTRDPSKDVILKPGDRIEVR